jgi:hypothetical protein
MSQVRPDLLKAHRRERVRRRRTGYLACLTVLIVALLGCVLAQAASAELVTSTGFGTSAGVGPSLEPAVGGESAKPEIPLTPSTTQRYTPCPPSAGLIAECNLVIDPVPIATPSGYQIPNGTLLVGSGEAGGLDPTDLQSAYKLPTTGGSGETVALVDAYGDGTAESDLNKYREKYKVYYKGTETACTKTNGCFKKVNVKGEEANYPAAGPGIWGAETALDIEMVSAACPECHILLVEASGEDPAETAAAVEEAAKLKATEISNSYGYSEDDESACPSKKGCKEYLVAYNQGIPVMASAGDGGYDNEYRGYSAPLWPAVSPNVIAVGGTELEKVEKPKEGERAWKEVVWPDSGSGCSLYESEPNWQEEKAVVPKACGKDRTDNDVASVAESVSIYTTPYEGGWGNVGGTSASSPFVAGVEAHANSATKKLGAEAFYNKPRMLFHISEGSNGSCGTEAESTYYLCHATKEGYNGPTGEGTPDGVFSVTAAPTVTTEAATSITKTAATLNGTVNPEGLETKYYFEYGTTESYGTKTAEVSAGSGNSNVKESKAITGLTPSTKYYFRIVATNSEGTMKGGGLTFTTLAIAKPKVETKQASNVTEAEATLHGTVNPEGSETKYYFEYGTTTSYGTKTSELNAGSGTSSLEENAAITSLLSKTEYHFRIVATNGGGTADGADQTFITHEPAWSLQTTLNPTGAAFSELKDVSCTSYNACTAVGIYGGAYTPLAERWNGTEWSLQTVPSAKAEFSELQAVSCASSTSCVAVGSDGYPRVPLAESWNGKEWSIQTIPAPKEVEWTELRSISCSSSSACTAVGVSGSPQTMVVERWNGSEGAVQTTPKPKGIEMTSLFGVSCASSTACTAVGWESAHLSTGPELNLAEHWNGTEWTNQEVPNPTGAENSGLSAVSCTASSSCTAVGHDTVSSKGVTQAVYWNGTEWKVQTTPNPTGPKESGLYGVSCTSSTACMAIGHYMNSEGTYVTLGESWNGSEWKVQTTLNPTGATASWLERVSCMSSVECLAVGDDFNSAGKRVTLGEIYH